MIRICVFIAFFSTFLNLSLFSQEWQVDWSDYAPPPNDQVLQGPCLAFANELMISTQYRIENDISKACTNFHQIPGVSPYSLHFYGTVLGSSSVSAATSGRYFKGRYEGDFLIPFYSCWSSSDFAEMTDECWFGLDRYGSNGFWFFEDIEKCADISCPSKEREANEVCSLGGNDPTSASNNCSGVGDPVSSLPTVIISQLAANEGAKVDDYIFVGTGSRASIEEALTHGPFVMKILPSGLTLLSDKYELEGIAFHGVLVIGIKYLENNRFVLKIADSWPGEAEVYETFPLENDALGDSNLFPDSWRIEGVSYLKREGGELVDLNIICEMPPPPCDVDIIRMEPSGSSILTLNSPNLFDVELSDPGVSIDNWSVRVSGGTVSNITGNNTLGNFHITPTRSLVSVEFSIACDNGGTASWGEEFNATGQTGTGGQEFNAGANKSKLSSKEAMVKVRLNAQSAVMFTDENGYFGKAYQVELFSISGQRVLQKNVIYGESMDLNTQLSQGVYFVRLIAKDGSYTDSQKVFVGERY